MLSDEEYEVQSERLDAVKQKCLSEMTKVYKKHQDTIAELGGDTEFFAMLILEQWRPW